MSLELWFHPDAEAELTDAADFYARQGPGLDTRFIAEVEHALGQIVRFPEAAPPVHGHLSRKVLPGYPFSLIYALTDTQIRVLAVAHQKRRPFYWRGRA
jgi:plasmid stabilization system protein ParE